MHKPIFFNTLPPGVTCIPFRRFAGAGAFSFDAKFSMFEEGGNQSYSDGNERKENPEIYRGKKTYY
jgi:hypothetical protein